MDLATRKAAVTRKKPAPSMLGQPLTSREAQVAALVAEGYSNRDIGTRLGITEQTVKNHLTATYDKTGVRSRVQLALRQVRPPAPEPPAR